MVDADWGSISPKAGDAFEKSKWKMEQVFGNKMENTLENFEKTIADKIDSGTELYWMQFTPSKMLHHTIGDIADVIANLTEKYVV